MKDSGLGTPATRADTIETLLKRQYLTRDGKALNRHRARDSSDSGGADRRSRVQR
jgi:DNA topoisomerase IA